MTRPWQSGAAAWAATVVLVGCGADAIGPPPITADQRQAIKQNLTALGAQVTADAPDGLYASLRNTHVEVRDVGGEIEAAVRTRRDVQDFWQVNQAVAKGFLDDGETTTFDQWLKQALVKGSPASARAEYERYVLSLTKAPLRVIFSQRAPTRE
jgi:hypothetical protein